MGQEPRDMARPSWKFEWNPNTILATVTLIGMALSVGAVYGTFESSSNELKEDFDTLEDKLDKKLDAYGALNSAVLMHGARIDSLERNYDRISAETKRTNEAVAEMSSDMKVVKEILLRVEASQTRRERGEHTR